MITTRITGGILIGIFTIMIIFHLLVLGGVIPYDLVWGGRLSSDKEMYTFELVSVLINASMLLVVAVHINVINWKVSYKATRVMLWFMAFLFLLNTLGNLLSENELERLIFTPLTLVLCLLCIRLASVKSNTNV